MIEVAIMIEGQDGLTWTRWMKLAKAVEQLGYVGLYRSDHYTNANPPDKDSLELWVSLTWLASHTSTLEFGPIVSPVSFRHPTLTARMGAAVDDLSRGRLHLGIGAGWQAREHTNYGWDLLETSARMDRLEEGLQVISQLLRSDTPTNFSGKYYRLNDAILLPRPERRTPILIGGNGPKRTLPLVARYADEWNAVFIPPSQIADLNRHLDELLEKNGRKPADVRRSLMTGVIMGRDEADLKAKAQKFYRTDDLEALRARGMVVGMPNEIADQLGKIHEAGVYRVMLQWMDQDDLDGLADLAAHVVRQV
jgi:F420-dependent oxidoreductase-like protein